MDPLSVAASIIGILAAATKVVELLTPVVSSLTESTKNAAILVSRIENSRNVLSALQKLLNNLNAAPQKRKELIPIDRLVASLTNGVFLFSELEATVLELGTSTENFRTRIQWARKDKTLSVMISRLQGFEISISAMLNILQCESDLEAAASQKELYESNLEMSQRLAQLEKAFLSKGGVDVNIKQATNRRSSIISGTLITQFEFANDLESSRPYRKAQRTSADFSFRSSVVPSHAWSALSDISLSDISTIAVVALPISSDDITNGHHYQIQELQSEDREEEQVGSPIQLEPPFKFATSSGVRATPAALTKLPISYLSLEGQSEGNTTLSNIAISLDSVSPQKQQLFPASQREYRLGVLGFGGVGKSAITIYFLLRDFIDEYDPTIEETYLTRVKTDDELAILDILDTGGQEESSALREQYIRTRRGFVLVDSITFRSSFEELIVLQQVILRVKGKERVPMIIVGNKCDLESEREVSTWECQTLASEFACHFVEVSAKTGVNVDGAFHGLVRLVRLFDAEMKASRILPVQAVSKTRIMQKAKGRKRWLPRTKRADLALDAVDEDE